jgi:restriction endonuclease S subunit
MSPFDKARYKRLLEGLEISEIPNSEALKASRFDSEFWRKQFIKDESLIKDKSETSPLRPLLKVFYRYPLFYGYEFTDSGIPVLKGEDICSSGLVLSKSGDHVTEKVSAQFPLTVVEEKDIIVSVRGSVGKVGLIPKTLAGSQISPNLIRLHPNSSYVRPEYLWCFLSCKIGQRYFDRFKMRTTQETIIASDIGNFLIPLLSEELQKKIAALINDALNLIHGSEDSLIKAEQTLMTELGLADWTPPEPLSYSRNVKVVSAAGRFDAEYFAPRVQELIKKLSAQGLTLGNVAPLRKEYFRPKAGTPFDYIEISDLNQFGETNSTRLDGGEAPSRAKWHVRKGYIITSTVRPIRRLTALIQPEQDNFVCSSGFAVLQPKAVPSELLLVYLRLPAICELMDLHTTASMYPAISVPNILALPFLKPSDKGTEKIISLVQSARAARGSAYDLLERAKCAVEIAIENSEVAALKFITGD